MEDKKYMKQRDLIQMLLDAGKITEENLNLAQEESHRSGLSILVCLENLKFLVYEDIAKTCAEALGVPYMRLENFILEQELLQLIPRELLLRYQVLPLLQAEDVLTIGMVNPDDIEALDHIQRIYKDQTIDIRLISDRDFREIINKPDEALSSTIETIIKGLDKKNILGSEEVEQMELTENSPIVNLVNLIIIQAIKNKVSDIHIEPNQDCLRVRYRVDGLMRQYSKLPLELKNTVTSRIKILAEMDISEVRLPQDGRIKFKVESREVDLRISTFPTIYGENVVIRLLDKASGVYRLGELGMPEVDKAKIKRLISSPNGIVLVTGPTGSGKSSTLYSALFTINSLEKNIVTVEEPVEYEMPIIRQSQVNSKIGFTFANGLRSILRQDPDIVMVGEIRDEETASIAVQAALTGHLVLSTLHTNDAVSAVTRLLDMNIKSFLISSALIGVIAQRLVKLNCKHCKEPYTPSEEVLKEFGLSHSENFYKGKGCEDCKKVGFAKRQAIFEILVIDNEIRKMIDNRAPSFDIKKKAIEMGMNTLRMNGLQLARKGKTTLEEILRVTAENM